MQAAALPSRPLSQPCGHLSGGWLLRCGTGLPWSHLCDAQELLRAVQNTILSSLLDTFYNQPAVHRLSAICTWWSSGLFSPLACATSRPDEQQLP